MSKKKPKILIIEDEKALGNALKMKLDQMDFEADVATNGNDGLAAIAKKKYNLVLLDLVMPVMDGFSVLKTLQQKKNKVPVIVVSNLSQTEDMEKAKKLGAVDFFSKSETPIFELVKRLKKHLKL